MPKLNQVLAIEKGRKTAHQKEITEVHKISQKTEKMRGHKKVFTPKKEDGETFPDDAQVVQLIYKEAIQRVVDSMSSMMDITATKDFANCHAKADIVVDDKVFLAKVPVPLLLFLEKELRDLHTFMDKMCELDPSEEWTLDENTGLRRSKPVGTQKTKKLQQPIVLYQATDHHPAQTQIITEDVVIGTWKTTKFSGGIPREEKKTIRARITKLEEAVKFAREKANSMEAEQQKIGDIVLDFIFKKGDN